MEKSENIIELNDVAISQRDVAVLKNISFKIKKGEFIYLIGKTGSGKSSLLKTFYGEIRLKKGEATVLNENIIKIRKRKILALRRKLGIVFQDFQLLSDRSIEDNIHFAMKATGWKGKQKIKTAIEDLLLKVGMQDKGKVFPHQLSGGEQQRIAIARALINDPELILADEPTGNLDPETSEEIMQLLFEINNNNKTIIMATHDYELIRKFPAKTFRFEDGSISEIDLIS
mgnify:CR=1 FL=1